MKKFSIIIPVYNVEPYLKKCLYSIEKQTYSNFEVIVIDDGSKDKSSQIAQKFVDKDTRYHLIIQENQGVSAARNAGIRYAKGDYLVFVDGDDFLKENYLEMLDRYILDEDMAIIDGFIRYYDKNNVVEVDGELYKLQEKLHTKDLVLLLGASTGNVGFATMSNVYRRNFIIHNQIYFSSQYSHFEDTDFAMQALVKEEKGCIVPGYYYFYRMREKSLSYQHSLKSCIDAITVFEKWFTILKTIGLSKYKVFLNRFSRFGNSYLMTGATLSYKERKQLWEKVKKYQSFFLECKDKSCRLALLLYHFLGYPVGVKVVYFLWQIIRMSVTK